MLHLHVNVEPYEKIEPIQYARLWGSLNKTVSAQGYKLSKPAAENSSEAHERNSFDPVKKFIKEYLKLVEAQSRKEQGNVNNALTLEIVTITRYLVHFGFYDFSGLLELTDRLLAVLDSHYISRHVPIDLWENSLFLIAVCMYAGRESQPTQQAERQQRKPAGPAPRLANAGAGMRVTMRNLNRTAQLPSDEKIEDGRVLNNIRLRILEIIEYVSDVRIDFRISQALGDFKASVV